MLGWPVAADALPGPAHSAAITVSPPRAGATAVVVKLVLGYEMQCGYPGPGPVVVTLPPGERVGRTLARSAVVVDGRPAVSVAVSGRTVTIGLAPAPQVMCDVIGPGRLTVLFLASAGLGNPPRAGSYTVRAARGSASFSAVFSISAA